MKKLVLFLITCPFLIMANDLKIPSKITRVTVYLSGAQITRTATANLNSGTSKITFTGLSTKVDENSIQIAGLQSVSILSMEYDINYLEKKQDAPQISLLEKQIDALELKTEQLKNLVSGLEEEQKLISKNQLINAKNESFSLEKIKQVSQYYRQRTTAIKNEIYTSQLQLAQNHLAINSLKSQLNEINNIPEKEQGELTIKFDAPAPTVLHLEISYAVQDAGWIPAYDIKSKQVNAPLQLTYKAHVYQKTGNDWENVRMTLSTGNPHQPISKPILGAKYINFVSSPYRPSGAVGKKKYYFNPTVKTVTGTVTDASGEPLPGCSITVKGTNKGTQTDFDGNYTLAVTGGKELLFSYIGYRSENIPIYASVMNVSLEEDVQMLDEVVVTGYGITSTLQGNVSGVQIRGANSIPQPKLPLYIIDGVPSENFTEGDLDRDEIQSVEMLKGQNATNVYGSKGKDGVIIITTKKRNLTSNDLNTEFVIKKPYTIASDGDITAIELNTHTLQAHYEYFSAPVINENVFLTASFNDWEQYNLLPGEANIYFGGSLAGKTAIDPFTISKEMIVSLGVDHNITISRKQNKNFKSNSFMGNNRILDRSYDLEVKNNKNTAIELKLMDRIPISQNKEIKVDKIEHNNATYDEKKGILTWHLKLESKENQQATFSYQVKYPKYKHVSL